VPPPIAVVDTSALFGHHGRKAIVEACNAGILVAVWSPHIVAELNRVLAISWLEKYGSSKDSLNRMSRSSKDMMDVLTSVFEIVDTGPTEAETAIDIKDIDDRHLMRAARLASAAYIISENTRDFPPADGDGRYVLEGVEFLRPSTFFDRN
jgi:predicted nucleic acid-binding protein